MTDMPAALRNRIETALARVEAALGASPARRDDALRSRTQAALAELDAVIARIERR